MTSIPKINRKKIMIRKAQDNSWILRLKQHPFSSPMVINKTSYDIIELIDGKRNVTDITLKICKKYNTTDEKRIEKDIMRLIALLWDFKVLEWIGEDPFERIYKFNNEKYSFALVRNYKNLNLLIERKYISPYINPKLELSIDGIEAAAFYTSLLCFTGTFANNDKVSAEVAVRFSKVDLSITIEALNINIEENGAVTKGLQSKEKSDKIKEKGGKRDGRNKSKMSVLRK